MTATIPWRCTLALASRPRTADGVPYDGEVLRYALEAVPAHLAGLAGEAAATRRATLELRLSGALLQSGSWPRLSAAELARHGQAYLTELVQHRGLPAGPRSVICLDVQTDQGAYRDGSPFRVGPAEPGPFEVQAPARPDEERLAER